MNSEQRKALGAVRRGDLRALNFIDIGGRLSHTRESSEAWSRLHDAGLLVTDGPTDAGQAALTAWGLAR